MRRYIVLVWLVGCSPYGAGDDDPPPPPGQVDDDAARDREECERARWADCPTGWARSISSGWEAHGEHFVELEDVAEPVCSGRGLYAEPDAFEGAIAGPVLTLVRNSQCTLVCYPQCSFTSVCYAKKPDGQACGDACSPPGLTEDECEAFVAECLGDASACGG